MKAATGLAVSRFIWLRDGAFHRNDGAMLGSAPRLFWHLKQPMCYILPASCLFLSRLHRGGKIASNRADNALPRLRPLRLFSRKCATEFSLAFRNAADDLIRPAIPTAEPS